MSPFLFAALVPTDDAPLCSGTSEDIPLSHSFNAGQIVWYQNGSALNAMGNAK